MNKHDTPAAFHGADRAMPPPAPASHREARAVKPAVALVALALAGAVAALVLIASTLSGASPKRPYEPPFPGRGEVAAPAAPAAAIPTTRIDELRRMLAAEIKSGLINVDEMADRAVITLSGDVFASGGVDVAARALPLLQSIAEALKVLPGRVVVVGHTDNVKPAMSPQSPSNAELSTKRADSVKKWLAERAGPDGRYQVEGRGDAEPVAPNDSAANRARNRRVVIAVLLDASAQP